MNIVIVGRTLTSAYGDAHAHTWRALIAALATRGHDVLFLERDTPWYAETRDLARPSYCRVGLYEDTSDLAGRYGAAIRRADLVVVGSGVYDGIFATDQVLALSQGVVAFYDLDTPSTLTSLRQRSNEYLAGRQIPEFDLYLSFTGGPVLDALEREFGAKRACALYGSVDPALYEPVEDDACLVDLSYLGTYSADSQPALDRLLLEPARRWAEGRFLVAGTQYPRETIWPLNVGRVTHLPRHDHAVFYGASRFTLNVTGTAMASAGYAPSVRLFEAAACGTPIISDPWPGLETLFTPGKDILVADSADQILEWLFTISDLERVAIGWNGRRRVLAAHTAAHRASELETAVAAIVSGQATPQVAPPVPSLRPERDDTSSDRNRVAPAS